MCSCVCNVISISLQLILSEYLKGTQAVSGLLTDHNAINYKPLNLNCFMTFIAEMTLPVLLGKILCYYDIT